MNRAPATSRARKLAGRILALVVASLLGIAATTLTPVDHTSYHSTSYYSNTVARIDLARSAAVGEGVLSAGFGQAKLTPVWNAKAAAPDRGEFASIPLAGYGSRNGKAAEGVLDDLFVKALALKAGEQALVIVSADALIIPREVTELAVAELRKNPGLERRQIYLSATHTHSSLGGWGEGIVGEAFAGPYDPGARRWFADRIATAVRMAWEDLGEASLAQGSFDAPQFVRNRLIGSRGRVDSEFSILWVRQADGDEAYLGAYAAHATTLSAKNQFFSADYPGSWQRAMKASRGGQAMFLAGGVGSHSPTPPATGAEGAEQMGRALADLAVETMGSMRLTNRVRLRPLGLEVDLPPLNVRVTDGLRLRNWLAAALLPVGASTFLQVCEIGDGVWISTPCDYSGEMALDLKAGFKQQGSKATVTSFNGDYVGYVVPRKYYHHHGYETRTMSFFGPNVPDYFEELIQRLGGIW